MTDKFVLTVVTNEPSHLRSVVFCTEYTSPPPIPNIGDMFILPNSKQIDEDTYKVVSRKYIYHENNSGCTLVVEPLSAPESTPTRHILLTDDIEAFNAWFKRNGYKDTHYYPCLATWEGCFAYAQHGGNPGEFCRKLLANSHYCLLYKGHDNGTHDG